MADGPQPNGARTRRPGFTALAVVRVIGLVVVVIVGVGVLVAATAFRHRDAGPSNAPSFRLQSLEPGGPLITNKDLTGRVALLAFWASWCVPCRSELPALARQVDQWPNLTLLAIDTDDVRSDGLGFLNSVRASTRAPVDAVYDPEGHTAEEFHLFGMPAAAVLTPTGQVSAKYLGPVAPDRLAREVSRARHR